MTAQRSYRATAAQVLAVAVGVSMAAALSPAAAHADSTSDAFLAALNTAGVDYADPGSAVELGQSICPMLSEPGGSFAKTASTLSAATGSPPTSQACSQASRSRCTARR